MSYDYSDEHPDDRAERLRAESEADKRLAAFVEEHNPGLVNLSRIYADDDAHELLDELREKFWTSVKP